MKNKVTERSLCCSAKVKIVGQTTRYYVCLKCKQACDIYFKERGVWNRNPKTQVIESKKNDVNKLTKAEIRKLLKEENF